MTTELKDSGVPWIGQIPISWNIAKIKRTTYLKGRVGWQGLTSEEYRNEGDFLLVTGTDFVDGFIKWDTCVFIDKSRFDEDPYIQLHENDVLITKDGTIGKVARVKAMPKPATLNSGVFVTRPIKSQYRQDFMYWVLSSDLLPEFIKASRVGTTIDHLYQKTFERFIYPLPPIKEQEFIAKYLENISAVIEAAVDIKRRQVEILYLIRKSTIHHAVTQGLNPAAKMKLTGIEWIPKTPEHWKIVRVKDVLDFFNTIRVPLSAGERGLMSEKIYDYYGASGIIDKVDRYLFDGTYILLAEDGANLLTRSKPLSFLATGKFWVNNHAHILKPRWNGDETFFVNLLESQDFSLFVTGAAQPKLTIKNLGKFKIAIPPTDEQKEIANFIREKISEFHKIVKLLEKQIEILVTYRKILIRECITGKRRLTKENLMVM